MPIGTKVRTSAVCGIDSDKVGHVCKHFTNNDGYEMSLKSDGWIPIQFNDIKTYLPESHLKELFR